MIDRETAQKLIDMTVDHLIEERSEQVTLAIQDACRDGYGIILVHSEAADIARVALEAFRRSPESE